MKTKNSRLRGARGKGKNAPVNKKHALLVLAGIFTVSYGVYALAGMIGSSAPKVAPEVAIANLKDPELAELKKLDPKQREEALKSYGKAIASNFGPRNSGQRPDESRRDEMRKIRETIDTLPENERKAFQDGMRKAFEGRRQEFEANMQKKIKDFFTADAATQEKMLEEDVARMKKMQEDREKRMAERAKSSDADKSKQKGNDNRQRFANRSKEDRESHMRERLNEHDPVERAQFQEYMRRLHEKMDKK